MNDWIDAATESAALDDARTRAAVPTRHARHARVDELLSRPGACPRELPPLGLHARVMNLIGQGSEETPYVFARTGLMALAATLLLGAGVAFITLARREAPQPPTPIAQLDAGAFTGLPARARALTSDDANPLVIEARLMRDDTERAARILFAQIPTRLRP